MLGFSILLFTAIYVLFVRTLVGWLMIFGRECESMQFIFSRYHRNNVVITGILYLLLLTL